MLSAGGKDTSVFNTSSTFPAAARFVLHLFYVGKERALHGFGGHEERVSPGGPPRRLGSWGTRRQKPSIVVRWEDSRIG